MLDVSSINLMKAISFSVRKHAEQKRKYTFEPYVCHCLSVVQELMRFNAGEPCYSAAILHDTIEDTDTTYEDIEKEFGTVIADIVLELTDPPLSVGNRAARKEITKERLKTASWYAKTIKYADIIDNISSIVDHDPQFAKLFLSEIGEIYPEMKGGDDVLYTKLGTVINEAEIRLIHQSLHPVR